MSANSELAPAPRRTVNFKVLHRNPLTQKFVSDFAKDVSVSGLFLRTHRVRPVGSELELQFPVDDVSTRMRPIKIQCVVTRVTRSGLGLRFKLEDEAVLKVLAQLVGK